MSQHSVCARLQPQHRQLATVSAAATLATIRGFSLQLHLTCRVSGITLSGYSDLALSTPAGMEG